MIKTCKLHLLVLLMAFVEKGEVVHSLVKILVLTKDLSFSTNQGEKKK